jgi:DNA-binding response OmpR family regulator
MTQRILLVEDNPSDVELVRTAFSELGIPAEYTVYHDGDEAIDGLLGMVHDEVHPHLVLLDLNLPRTSGHEVLDRLRELPYFDTVPVIVLSTSNHPVDRSRSLAAGADDYLVKPPRYEELLALVANLRDRWLQGPR